MPKSKTNDEEFRNLYNEVRRQTTEFKKITADVISQNPHYIRAFRMLCGKSMTQFGQDLGKTHATIAQYERKAIKKIPIKEAEKISEFIKDALPPEISFETAISNLRKFREMSHGGYIQAFIRAEKAEMTNQEKNIKEILENKKTKYEIHKTMDTSIGQLNFDFWLPEKKIVIECTESVSKHKAESLGFRIIKLKDKIRCKSVVIVPKNVSNGIIRRLPDYDYIIFSNELTKLEGII